MGVSASVLLAFVLLRGGLEWGRKGGERRTWVMCGAAVVWRTVIFCEYTTPVLGIEDQDRVYADEGH